MNELNSYYPLEVEEDIVRFIQTPRTTHNIPFKILDIFDMQWRQLI